MDSFSGRIDKLCSTATSPGRVQRQSTGNVYNISQPSMFANNMLHNFEPYVSGHNTSDAAQSSYNFYSSEKDAFSETACHDPNFAYQNTLPSASIDSKEDSSFKNGIGDQPKEFLPSLLWPAFVICVPIAILSAVLLTIIFKYQVEPRSSLFEPSMSLNHYRRQSYLLVDFSATQIVFLASFLSTVAPLLAGCIMSLTSILVCRSLRHSSDRETFSMLPSPYQMSLLVGLLSASYSQLLSAMGYLLSRKRTTKAPPILLYAAAILVLSVLLGITVTVTDAVLHYVTQTVSFDLYSLPSAPTAEHGRRLNQFCANFNRVDDNNGFPCSRAASQDFYDPDFWSEQAEIQYLLHNTSSISEIRHGLLNDEEEADVAFLVPESTTLPSGLDYRATTIGVSSECQLIPSSNCGLTSWGPNGNIYTSFNCSKNFWGVLGMNSNITETNANRQPSEYISMLSVKPQSNLQYGFFSDLNLQSVYNPAGLNDSAMPDPNIDIISDNALPLPIYMAFAWRSSVNAFASGVGNEMVSSTKALYNTDQHWLDYFLSCKIATYDVEYVWFNNTVRSTNTKESHNGKLLNMWQGLTNYGASIAGGGHAYQDFNFQAAIAGNTTSSYEQRFGQLISDQVLATIGGYSTGQVVLQQQERRNVLLAKVPKAALGFLLACSLMYPILGIVLFLKAYSSSQNDASMRDLFSYWGLAAAAWHDTDERRISQIVTPQQIKSCGREENIRLYVRGDAEKGFHFGVWKRAASGDVIEMQRSQTNVATYI